ncbi:MAG: nucleotidyltransferase family protein [Acidimicrobiales bacterium]
MDFVVRTDVACYQERLVKMGWQPDDEAGTFTRRLDGAADIEAIFERFSRHIETMVRHSARLDPVDWQQGLELLAGRAEHSPLRWWLYGSGALAVRGIPIEPGDLDVHVDDADLAGELLVDHLVEPVTRMHGWVADAGGRAFAGVLVEWLAGAQPSGLDPPHEYEDAADAHLELVSWHGHHITVPRLGLQLAVAERRGLSGRAALIREAIGS